MRRSWLVALPLMLGAWDAQGATLTVGLDGGQYDTINAAVDAARNRDIVLVYPGVYTENVDFDGKSITLRSTGGPTSTTIQGTSQAIYMHGAENGDTRVEGFTLKTTGSYILRIDGADPTFQNCVVSGARSSYAGYFLNSDATLDGVTFQDNQTSYNLYAQSSNLIITGGAFLNNRSSSHGGGIHMQSASTVEVRDSRFLGNTAGSYGGAIYVTGADYLTVDNSEFRDNSASYGGAIAFGSSTSPSRISNVEMTGNQATNYGGAMWIASATVHVNDAAVVDNVATQGGGFYLSSAAHLAVHNSTFVVNDATKGGHIYQYRSSDLQLLNNIFTLSTGGYGVETERADARFVAWYNLFYDNYPDNFGGNAADLIGVKGNIEADPLLDGFIDDRDSSNDDFALGEGSPGINAGSPTFKDADGSRGDLGVGGSNDLARSVTGDIVVAPQGLGDYADIAQAVAAAEEDDTIVVYAGHYHNNVNFSGKNVKIVSAYGAHATLATGTSHLFTYTTGEDDSSLLQGLTLWTAANYTHNLSASAPVFRQNHYMFNPSYVAYTNSSNDVRFEECIFESNTGPYVLLSRSSSDMEVVGSTFRDNATTSGGAIKVEGSGSLTTRSSLFINNYTPQHGAGIYFSGGTDLIVEGSQFYANNAAKYGGAVYADSINGYARLSDNTFQQNTANQFGGALYLASGSAYLNDNIFADNKAITTGGAIYANSSAHLGVVNNTFYDNRAPTGGHIYGYRSLEMLLLNNILASSDDGAAIDVNNNTARVLSWYNLFHDNADGVVSGAAVSEIGVRGNFSANPLITGYTDNGIYGDDNIALSEASPAIDAGTPSFKDVDGSPADLGAGGGFDLGRSVSGDVVVAYQGTRDYTSLVAAVAGAERGDRIVVYPGVYFGNVDLNGKNVEIVSAFGPEVTTVSSPGTTFTYDASEDERSLLQGFTIMGTSSHSVYVSGTSPKLRDLHFRYHASSYAFYALNGDIELRNCLWEDNRTSYTAYFQGTDATLVSPIFHDNYATSHGGGIYMSAGSNLTVTGGSFEDNAAASYGGAIHLTSGANLQVLDSTFLRNTASYGGAIYLTSATGQVEVRNSVFAFNEATTYGGALYNTASRLYFADNKVIENEAVRGGGLHLDNGSFNAILNDTIVGNSAQLGGGIYVQHTSDTLLGNSIIAYQYDGEGIYTSNVAARVLQVHTNLYENYDGNYGGALTDQTGRRGNLAVEPKFISYSIDGDLSNDNLTLAAFSSLRDAGIPDFKDADGSVSDMGFGGGDDDARVTGYTYTVSAHGAADFRSIQEAVAVSRNGDTIAVYPGVYANDVDFDGKDLQITGIRGPLSTVLAANSYGFRLDSGEGGGIITPKVTGMSVQSRGAYGVYLNGTVLDMDNVHIRYCRSSYSGYAQASELNLKDVVFEDNQTTYGMRYYTSTGTIENADFLRNTATSQGGGLYVGNSSDVDLVNTHFIGNYAASHGGGIYVTASQFEAHDSVFSNNRSNTYGGAIYGDSASRVDVFGSMLALNTATTQGGAVYLASTGTNMVAKNNIWMANSSGSGGALSLNTNVTGQITNNDFLENGATGSGGAVYAHSGATLRSVNNIIAHQDDEVGIYVHASASYDIRYNLFYQNYQGALGISSGSIAIPTTNVADQSPAYVSYIKDRNPTNDDLHLATGSPAIDAGDPGLEDADGSRSDIGAYGGAGAPSLDFDGDGYTTTQGDCDDTNDTVYPGAPELEDGLDNDCNGIGDDPYVDQDSDGYSFEEGDCDDADEDINPGATESCDGSDNNCNGVVDEGVSTVYYADGDDDGYGDSDEALAACTPPAGYTRTPGDCDDAAGSVYPGADEVCDDLDNNCNGQTDEVGDTTYYLDPDGDGYGTTAGTVVACDQPSGYAAQGGDCNEGNAGINPGATESCDSVDNNCDGRTDEGLLTTFYGDSDGDGYGTSSSPSVACEAPAGTAAASGDCDDSDAGVNPGASEVCDGDDNDCDFRTDEGLTQVYYADGDGDGYGQLGSTTQACDTPAGYAPASGDCNDSSAQVNPGAIEVCDGVDNDCNGAVDEELRTTFYADDDGDGYGDSADSQSACERPADYVVDGGDCNDSAGNVNPGATEVCDGLDNNCDGSIDEGFDGDGDGVPACAIGGSAADCDDEDAANFPGNTEACDGGDNDCDGTVDEETDDDEDGFTGCDGDCDDSNPNAYPGASEVCDGADNNCDGSADEGFDADGDGYPTCQVGDVPADCLDDVAEVNPGAAEVCDGDDNDCDGIVDNGFDADSDGYPTCEVGGLPADCADGQFDINPGATEICDSVDNDCDGATDEGTLFTYCIDTDGDGFGSPSQTQTVCEPTAGYVRNCTDVDDTEEDSFPGAEEVPDGKDNDGDGVVDEGTIYYDDDGDGASEAEGDCDDDSVQVGPGVGEFADGIDNDCDGSIDEETSVDDGDGDGVSPAQGDCDDTDPDVGGQDEVADDKDNDCDGDIDEDTSAGDDDDDGYSEDDGDCDDDFYYTHPNAPEYADGVDNDCDGQIDEDIDDVDDDGDNGSEADGDCDDTRPDVGPDAPELDDGVDNDCDGIVDEGTSNFDEDGDGFSPADGDCDDGNPYVFPGATEIPNNGVDDNCDGVIDGEGPTPTPGEETGSVSLDRTVVDFGTVFVDSTNVEILSVSNLGLGTLTITEIELVQAGDTFAVLEDFPLTVDAEDTERLLIEFAPLGIGSYNAILTLSTDDPENDEVTVLLQGVAMTPGGETPTVGPTPTPMETETPTETVTPTEAGDTPTVTATPTEPGDTIPPDASPTPTGPGYEEGGCECSGTGTSGLPSGTALLLLAAFGLRLRRRRD